MAEKNKRKAEYLKSRFPKVKAIFDDCSQLCKPHACTVDGGSSRVPEAQDCRVVDSDLRADFCSYSKSL